MLMPTQERQRILQHESEELENAQSPATHLHGGSEDDSSIPSVSAGSGADPPLCGFRLTGFRLLTLLSTSGFGVVKAILSYLGHSTAPTTLDWAFGVVITVVWAEEIFSMTVHLTQIDVCRLYAIWWRKEDSHNADEDPSQLHRWLFERDFAREVLGVLGKKYYSKCSLNLMRMQILPKFCLLLQIH
ncbi:hypothetical protein M422DRAFT_52771 [Sphaerobolus stellatus SS14]|uniref:Uncharacterized protein n=1 Tax=Sphaerobolus stellatus (strain SS14) TaxID=990650 RepID=A0A0C9UTP5_SPHS4|nr:hypothetical protein M422DRAFT_52771 [Sphaerobolus stellatus SS14]